ncbi:MAG: dimethylarginine dimethylaminohydrolase family protein [Nocardioides sp.]|uniref:dimethylarginine dimethylaminohydrolase family protein n=1 Tax=Nocardioides sp. TaxID=35761 RepID=UPI003F11EF19
MTVTTGPVDPAGRPAPAPGVAPGLPWGREYVMVRPSHFRVEYVINPFMDTAVQPDPERAMGQWEALVDAIHAAGGTVDALDQREDAPDMVYAMNLGLGFVAAGARSVIMSHMRHPQRRIEGLSAQPWFTARGSSTRWLGGGVRTPLDLSLPQGSGPHFEAGDAFAWRGELLVGYGPRTEQAALDALAELLGVRVVGLQIAHPGMYHLDLAFCPVDHEAAIVCPAALADPSARALLDRVPHPILLTEEEALTTFAANSVVVGRTVLVPDCPAHVRRQLEARGLEVVVLDLSEFHKGGGSARCLTNPVDLVLGRDLEHVAGGEVVLP